MPAYKVPESEHSRRSRALGHLVRQLVRHPEAWKSSLKQMAEQLDIDVAEPSVKFRGGARDLAHGGQSVGAHGVIFIGSRSWSRQLSRPIALPIQR
jgi:hypothetical protein